MKPEDYAYLLHMKEEGLMRTTPRNDVEERLVDAGYLKRGVGGHVLTNKSIELLYKK